MTQATANRPFEGLGAGGYTNYTPYAFALTGDNRNSGTPYYISGRTTSAANDRRLDRLGTVAPGGRTGSSGAWATSRTVATGGGNGSGTSGGNNTTTNRRRRRRRRNGGGGGGGGGSRAAAIRDVNLALNAQIDAINREQQQAYYDYLNRVNGVNAAYGGFNQMVGNMMAPYQQQSGQVMSNLNSALAPYRSSQGNVLGLDAAEYMNGQGSFDSAAAAAQGLLSSMGQRGQDYLTSAQNEGALSQRYAQDNLLQRWEDSQNQYAQLRLDATDHAGDYILQRLDEIKNQALQNSALKQQLTSNAAFSDMLAKLVGSMM